MTRTLVYLKVELEHSEEEKTARMAEEICRRVQKIYGVRSAEVSNIVAQEDK